MVTPTSTGGPEIRMWQKILYTNSQIDEDVFCFFRRFKDQLKIISGKIQEKLKIVGKS
jgi:hypothetical protein